MLYQIVGDNGPGLVRFLPSLNTNIQCKYNKTKIYIMESLHRIRVIVAKQVIQPKTSLN